jgi:N-acetylmuramic acid 6-phosphate etherase
MDPSPWTRIKEGGGARRTAARTADTMTWPPPSRTEMRNDRTTEIDTVGTLELLRLLNAEDAVVAGAVAAILPALADVVDLTIVRVRGGGHVHYFGAGSSGRIGVLDAAEVVPTFGVEADLFAAHHAGGESAVAHAVEGAEDREPVGRQAAAEITAADVAVGLSASGRTPYVAGALRTARAAGALTVLVSSNLSAPLAELADRSLLVDTGPEAITGSTRLKAATAQKMILNSLSTAVMIRLGRTYSNLMVSLSGTNAKLRQRQISILTETSGATDAACRAALTRCDGDLQLAVLYLLSGLEPEAAAQALAAGGSVRAALAATGTAAKGPATGRAGVRGDRDTAGKGLVMTPPPPRLTASYQALAEGYPAVSQLLLRQLADGFPPAVAIRVGTSGGSPYSAAGGWARLTDAGFPEPVPADADTLFDLASLTKVVVTLPLVLLLHQRGRWSIEDPVARWLPGAPRSPVTISDCLLHAAGLVPHRPYYESCADPAEIRRAVIAELADAVPGPVSYSDLGFMLLGWAVQECAGEPLAELAEREVLGPLGMTSTGYRPRAPLQRIAATEAGGDQRPGSEVVWGSVHDGNAFALGGVSGHAGLFGTTADLGRFASALLVPDRHPVLSAETIALMTARRAGTGAEPRVLGWRLRPDSWGDWPDGTIWHTGFTGTSLLIAPALDVAVVLLSNAVHPVRRLDQIGAFRAQVHRAIRLALDHPEMDSGACG